MNDVSQPKSRPLSRLAIGWREAVAALGVTLSLLFVGLEIRQNTTAVAAAALNDLSAGTQEWLLAAASDAELAAGLQLWAADDPSLTAAADYRVTLLVLALLRNAENVFLQGSLGVIDALSLQGYGLTESPIFSAPRFPALWRRSRNRFHPDFVAELEALYELTPR